MNTQRSDNYGTGLHAPLGQEERFTHRMEGVRWNDPSTTPKVLPYSPFPPRPPDKSLEAVTTHLNPLSSRRIETQTDLYFPNTTTGTR